MIVFSHANSYPASTYRYLFQRWRAAGHEVVAVERYGHEPQYGVDTRWRGMSRQLTDLIDAQSEPKLWLVGHSLGGFLSLIAAGLRPQRVQGAILLDSPVIGGWRSGFVTVAKATGAWRRLSPAAVAEGRRDRWASVEEAQSHFAQKKLFARWHPDILRDYVQHGTVKDPAEGSRRLAFRREIEADIYDTVPHWLVPWLRRHPPGGPVAFIAGKRSREIRQAGLAASERIAEGRVSWIDGTHLYPFERPDETVAAVLDWMRRLAPTASAG